MIYAGHSMGGKKNGFSHYRVPDLSPWFSTAGHGAWELATHYPDRALGVVSIGNVALDFPSPQTSPNPFLVL